MMSGSKMIKLLHACLGVAILTAALSHGSENHESQDCGGGSKALAAAQTTSPNRAPESSNLSTASPSKARGVRLSWNASVPASNSPPDAIKGYDIYRREPGEQYEKINRELMLGTSCVDKSVKAGQTYDYQTVAVSARGTASKPSNVAKATIPSR
jgi:hypothetical protein